MKEDREQHVLPRAAGGEPERNEDAFELPVGAIGQALHASPLVVSTEMGESRAGHRLPVLILGNAAIVSVGIVAAALIVRSDREQVLEPSRADDGPDALESRRALLPQARIAKGPDRQPSSLAEADDAIEAPKLGSAHSKAPSPHAPGTLASLPEVTSARTVAAEETAKASRERPRARRAIERRDAPAATSGDRGTPARTLAGTARRESNEPGRANPWLMPRARARGYPRLQYRPSRAQVIAAMRRVTPAVYACFEDGRGFALVRFAVHGQSGRIKSARVIGQSGPHVRCITQAVRRARLPKFSKRTLQIDYPFKR